MGTRSDIILKHPEEDEYVSIYCQWDGYLSGVGKILLENYKTHEQVVELIQLGELSELYETIEDCVSYYSLEGGPIDIYVNSNFNDHITSDYSYLFNKGEWFYTKAEMKGVWQKLTPEVISKNENG